MTLTHAGAAFVLNFFVFQLFVLQTTEQPFNRAVDVPILSIQCHNF